MKTSVTIPCPLCSADAKAFPEDYASKTHYFCPGCREIKVTKSVIERLRSEPADVKAHLSAQARSLGEGEYLYFSVAPRGMLPGGQSRWQVEVRRQMP